MYTRTIVLLASAVVLTACDHSNGSPTGPTPDSAPALAMHGGMNQRERPLIGSCELNVEILDLNFPILRQRDFGVCHLSHLGRAEMDGTLEINLLQGTQTGTRTFTAANGDELYASVQGTSAPVGPGLIGFSATFTFTGGTGRFVNASGTATGDGVANQLTQSTSVQISGAIRY